MRRLSPALLFILACGLGTQTGCVDVNGGAVELSWDIRRAEGGTCSCERSHITGIQLACADPEDNAVTCNADRSHFPIWSCQDGRGSTRFEIPPGTWQLSILVSCEEGFDCEPRVPDPIVRTVEEGKVVQLNALAIVVDRCGS